MYLAWDCYKVICAVQQNLTRKNRLVWGQFLILHVLQTSHCQHVRLIGNLPIAILCKKHQEQHASDLKNVSTLFFFKTVIL